MKKISLAMWVEKVGGPKNAAKILGIHFVTMYRYLSGSIDIPLSVVDMIIRDSGGQVSFESIPRVTNR